MRDTNSGSCSQFLRPEGLELQGFRVRLARGTDSVPFALLPGAVSQDLRVLWILHAPSVRPVTLGPELPNGDSPPGPIRSRLSELTTGGRVPSVLFRTHSDPELANGRVSGPWG